MGEERLIARFDGVELTMCERVSYIVRLVEYLLALRSCSQSVGGMKTGRGKFKCPATILL